MHASDPTFPLYPILSFLAIVVSFIPFPWHYRARNIGTCSYMLSTGLYSLVEFINSIIWADNVNNVAPVWCDISAQTIIGASVGITSSTLVISRQLYNISTMSGRSTTPQERRRETIINCIIAFGLPLLVMALHFIVQPRRFDIFEEIGCQPATFNTVAAYILYSMWPVLIGLCSCVYSVLTLRNFYNHRVEFAKVASTNSGMSPSRYIRLMLLVFVDMFCNTPIGVFAIIVASRAVVLPFSALSESVDFAKIDLVPASVWKADRLSRAAVEINHWVPVFCSFVFFVFFGFAEEAKKNYQKAYESLKRLFGCRGSRAKANDNPKTK
ncbi:pheromone receptor [Lentinula raphanica]|nr:pheromone receptor [Lentinula raphanica]